MQSGTASLGRPASSKIMTEINYSLLLREIVADYLEERISRVQYLAQRKSLLDRIDHEFNGEDDTSGWPEPDITQPVDNGVSPDTTQSAADENQNG